MKRNKKEYLKEYYKKNKERLKKDYEDNKDKILASRKEYYSKNKDKIRKDNKKYYDNNIEKVLLNKKKYRSKNKQIISQEKNNYKKERLKKDPVYKLKCNIKCLIRNSIFLKGFKKNSKTAEILGCTIGQFKEYLESQFKSWMNWNNYGKYNGELNYGWDIDHIIPSSSASTENEVIQLNHYTNLQPLCSKINRDIKKNKY